MDAITLIKKDHDKVEELFARYDGGGGLTGLVKRITGNVPVRQKTTALEGICRELDVHARIEEDILYPALRKTGDPELQRQVDESIREHARVKDLVGKLRTRTGEPDADTDAMVSELQQCVDHHVREEENEMFPRMEEVVPEPERRELGRQLQERKRTLAGGTARRARPAARGRTRTAGVRRSVAKKTAARPRKKRARR
jgi:iron-sulfur cluster repair protein YtfE (RIC family)